MHRAARHGIRRDPRHGYHGQLYVRRGKRRSTPSTVSEAFFVFFFYFDSLPPISFVIPIYRYLLLRWLYATELQWTGTPERYKVQGSVDSSFLPTLGVAYCETTFGVVSVPWTLRGSKMPVPIGEWEL